MEKAIFKKINNSINKKEINEDQKKQQFLKTLKRNETIAYAKIWKKLISKLSNSKNNNSLFETKFVVEPVYSLEYGGNLEMISGLDLINKKRLIIFGDLIESLKSDFVSVEQISQTDYRASISLEDLKSLIEERQEYFAKSRKKR